MKAYDQKFHFEFDVKLIFNNFKFEKKVDKKQEMGKKCKKKLFAYKLIKYEVSNQVSGPKNGKEKKILKLTTKRGK